MDDLKTKENNPSEDAQAMLTIFWSHVLGIPFFYWHIGRIMGLSIVQDSTRHLKSQNFFPSKTNYILNDSGFVKRWFTPVY